MKPLFALAVCILVFSAVAAELDMNLLKAIGNDRTRWAAHSHGAETRECFRVVDSGGKPVTNANVRCAFKVGVGASGLQDVYGVTDTNGLCTINGMCKAYMDYSVAKDGYYCSHGKVDYMETTRVPAVIGGKWQPYGETRMVVLKKVKNPYAVKVFNEKSHRRNIPVFGEWVGFDLEDGDFLPPYGSGRHEDVSLRFKSDVRKRRIDYTYVMDVCFTNNPYGGAYIMKEDACSDLKTEYLADTNANYRSVWSFATESIADLPVKYSYLDHDSYLVFRTRTRVDENGRLVGAHYGKVRGIWRSTQKEMLLNDGCFNPVENEPNIEGDQTLFYKLKNNKR